MTDQPASPESFDWSKTTYQGARREQLRRWAALPLEKMLAALEEMEEINNWLYDGNRLNRHERKGGNPHD